MTIHTIAPPNLQLPLLTVAPSFNITKNAQARNAYGTVAAELVCAILHLTSIPINGSYSVCFDAASPSGTYYEIKSVRSGGKVVIYDWRMEKEEAAGVPLCYTILTHRVRRSDGRHLVREMIGGGLELVVLPAKQVHEAARQQPRRKLMELPLDDHPVVRNGYQRRGYRDGYRNVPVKVLQALCEREERLRCNYAEHIFEVTVRTTRPGATAP